MQETKVGLEISFGSRLIEGYSLVPSDGKKEKRSKAKVPMPTSKKIEPEISEEEEDEETEENEEEDPSYQEGNSSSDDSVSDGGSDTEEDIQSDDENASTQSVSQTMKRTKAKRVKGEKKKASSVSGKKRKASFSSSEKKRARLDEGVEERKEKSFEKKKLQSAESVEGPAKKEMPSFSDKNVDYDLFNSSASNVVPRRIKVSNNIVVTCRMVEQKEGRNLTYDYPAITFQRKTTGEKMFEFILPLSLAPKITEAINLLIKDNSKFFNGSTAANALISN